MSVLYVLLFTLVLLCVLEYSHQQVENDGGCSCSCSSADVQTSAHSSGFQQGQPGKRGPLGPPGSPGQQGIQGPPGEGFSGSYGSAFNPGRSCADLRTNGITEDGVYFIKTGSISSVFQVYCDMSTRSTGWTLVGSIHENNVFGKCTQGDKWSSEEGNTNITNEGKAWTDTDIFGNVESATSADYKNPGFFTLASSNVMLWHVPNDTPLSRYKQDATLMYATDNNFLSLTGFTLQSLFKDHYSLTKHSAKGANVIDSLINTATSSAQQITNAITSFHQYTYDGSSSAILDGGDDLFDTGNKMQYAINDNSLSADLVYGHTYADSGVQIKTWPGHPFIALAYFRSTSNVNTFKLRVSSDLGADGTGSVTTYTETLNAGNTVIYRANHVYGAGDPSCAQVFFFMTDHPHSSDSVSTPEWENSDTNNLDDTFMVRLSQTTGPRNIIVGYMLLSKTSGSQITSSEIQTAIQRLMTPLSTVLRAKVIDSLINTANESAQQITNAITSFHQYTYDGSSSAILDGGDDLFDTGNKIQYAINDNSLSADLVYGHTYADSGVQIKTWPGHPFIALAYFRSTSNVNTFKLRVSSNLGADGTGSVTTYTGTLNAGNTVIYRANHVYGASGDPSCAQVFFFMTDHPHSSDSVSTPEWENSDTQNLDDTFMVRLSQTAAPRNIIVGYMLLTKTNDSRITFSEIQTAIQRLMTPLSTVLRVADVESCSSENETLSVPVNFLRGEIAEVIEAIPNAFRSSFQPGFIHFRPFDTNGIPRAMCPGVRSDGCSPYEACVGGINTYKYNQEFQCGDFVRHNLSAILVFYGP
ncbi:uncharacterized protein LOC143453533 isoform X2 [Clavelina lepadiformis]|uniref:uncharacterized protein LOC143453533 isoform X2 n=1 Tax=Clavelina lepadiformis TaxID=159417 RepID=UPI0040431CB2